MENYDKFVNELNDLGIFEYSEKLITDQKRIDELVALIHSGRELPQNIKTKVTHQKEIDNQQQFKDVDKLPEYISLGYFGEVKEQVEIDKIVEFQDRNEGKLPDNITSESVYIDNGYNTVYYDSNKPVYVENVYEFHEWVRLSQEDMEFRLKILNAKSNDKIASALSFFQWLTIISLMILIGISIIVIGLIN